MARVLGGKYSPNNTFPKTNLGTNPSYTWRGIWEARDVVQLGIRKRIGNGSNTMIWSGPWIPRTQTRMVVSPHGGSRTDMRVAELNAPDGVSWNVPPVQLIFLPFEQDWILSIRLSCNSPDFNDFN
ncbi:hypothetical protein RND81_02G098100 [Saponaria officinalis]|uniref:Uncharacterized protein n=1 Tax=Saponaria officinalis TaxID=3572 RepID=A0AAW1MX86_SAPOF